MRTFVFLPSAATPTTGSSLPPLPLLLRPDISATDGVDVKSGYQHAPSPIKPPFLLISLPLFPPLCFLPVFSSLVLPPLISSNRVMQNGLICKDFLPVGRLFGTSVKDCFEICCDILFCHNFREPCYFKSVAIERV